MLSVIIPTYNEKETIKETINKILSSSINKNFEIIIVDSTEDNSTIKKNQNTKKR